MKFPCKVIFKTIDEFMLYAKENAFLVQVYRPNWVVQVIYGSLPNLYSGSTNILLSLICHAF